MQFPGGESFADLRRRVIREIERLRRAHFGETIVVVTHGGVRHNPQGPQACDESCAVKRLSPPPSEASTPVHDARLKEDYGAQFYRPCASPGSQCHRLERARPYPNIHAHMHTQADANGDPYPIMRQAPTPRSAWKRIYPRPGGPRASLSAGWQRARIGPVQRSPVPSPTGGTR